MCTHPLSLFNQMPVDQIEKLCAPSAPAAYRDQWLLVGGGGEGGSFLGGRRSGPCVCVCVFLCARVYGHAHISQEISCLGFLWFGSGLKTSR